MEKIQTSEFKQIKVVKFRSGKTGLTCVHLHTEGPLVEGNFALSTPITNDSGCPHTLGSSDYPYKGVLDKLANRCYANGTNAWTDIDHTAYTISAAGSDGFLRLLPIYLDHILFPTLTSAGFITEVHHINEEGKDAGVVYSEMQGVENTSDSLMELEAQRAMFPEGVGYRSETGGLTPNLRQLTIEEIRKYHGQYYVARNLCLVIIGNVDDDELLKVLKETDEGIAEKESKQKELNQQVSYTNGNSETTNTNGTNGNYKSSKPYTRPWSDVIVPPLTKSSTITIDFPEKDESAGELMIKWLGPDYLDFYHTTAIEMLGLYFTESPVSVFEKEFVEIDEPLCSSTDCDFERRKVVIIYLSFHSVPTEELEDLKTKAFELLEKTANEPIDTDRMRKLIEREKLQCLLLMETDVERLFSSKLIEDYVYGEENGKSLDEVVKRIAYYDQMLKLGSDDWRDLIQKYFIDNHSCTIIGTPSAKKQKEMESVERDRVKEQVKKLGPDGLTEKKKILDHAIEANEIEAPEKIIADFYIPPVSSINFINNELASRPSTGTSRSELQKLLDRDSYNLPFPIYFSNAADSEFVSIKIILSPHLVDKELLPYIDQYVSTIFETSIRRNGEIISHEDLISLLDEETVHYDAGLGAGKSFYELIQITYKVQKSKYPEAVNWLSDLLKNKIYDEDRISTKISQTLLDIPSEKRRGSSMLNSVLKSLNYDINKSTLATSDTLFQEPFLNKLEETLDKEPESVINSFYSLQKQLLLPEAIRIHVVGDIGKVENPISVWKNFDCHGDPISKLPGRALLGKDVLRETQELGVSYVVPIPAVDGSYMCAVTAGVSGKLDKDYAALAVLIAYLNILEGLLWRQIRGVGLAYGANLEISLASGNVNFQIYRSPNAYKAYVAAKKIIEDIDSGNIAFDELTLGSAKSGLIYGIAAQESYNTAAAENAFIDQSLMNLPTNWRTIYMDKLESVTIDDLKRVNKKYLCNAFNPKTSFIVTTASPSLEEDLKTGYEKAGFEVRVKTLEDFQKAMGVVTQ